MVLLLSLALILTFVGCAPKADPAPVAGPTEPAAPEQTPGKIDKIKSAGKIVLGTAADYPPYEFHKLINGKDEIVGFDIEIAKAIAADLGVELVIKDMKFDGLLAALVLDDIDFIIAGMVPTDERKKTVDFSDNYYQAEQKLLIRTADADKFKTAADFKGKKVGAQKSTVQEDIANNEIEGAEVKALSKLTDLVLELKNKKVDAIVMVGPVADSYAKQNPDLMIPEIAFGQNETCAIAVNKGNEDLVEAINQTIERLLGDGSIDRFIEEATALAEEE